MRIVDVNLNTIDESVVDLTKGHLVEAQAIREDASPIDNKVKFAWGDDDYEPVKIYVPNKVDSGSPSYHAEIETLKGENEALKSQVGALRKTIFDSI